jgi:hypothetical protein
MRATYLKPNGRGGFPLDPPPLPDWAGMMDVGVHKRNVS